MCNKVTKCFVVYKLGLSNAFHYICDTTSNDTVKRLLLTLIMVLSANTVFPQDAPQADSLGTPAEPAWLSVGLGTDLHYPLAFRIGFSRPFGKNLLSARFQRTDEFDLHRQSSSESLWNIGLLFGRMVERDAHLFAISAGLAYVGGRIRGEFQPDDSGWGGVQQMKKCSSVGIPIEMQYIRTISANVGFGLCAFGDLNPIQPSAGIALTLHLGLLP